MNINELIALAKLNGAYYKNHVGFISAEPTYRSGGDGGLRPGVLLWEDAFKELFDTYEQEGDRLTAEVDGVIFRCLIDKKEEQ